MRTGARPGAAAAGAAAPVRAKGLSPAGGRHELIERLNEQDVVERMEELGRPAATSARSPVTPPRPGAGGGEERPLLRPWRRSRRRSRPAAPPRPHAARRRAPRRARGADGRPRARDCEAAQVGAGAAGAGPVPLRVSEQGARTEAVQQLVLSGAARGAAQDGARRSGQDPFHYVSEQDAHTETQGSSWTGPPRRRRAATRRLRARARAVADAQAGRPSGGGGSAAPSSASTSRWAAARRR